MGLDLAPWARAILRCPACGSTLSDTTGPTEAAGEAGLACDGPECGLVYPVRQGIPVLLVDEARPAHPAG